MFVIVHLSNNIASCQNIHGGGLFDLTVNGRASEMKWGVLLASNIAYTNINLLCAFLGRICGATPDI